MGALNFNTVLACMYFPIIGLLCGYGLAFGLAQAKGIPPADGPPAKIP